MSRDILTLLAFIVGAAAGSFLNVFIHRSPRNESVITPPSHCPHCRQPIRPWENIPLISYLILRGKCSSCGERIPVRYPLVEFLSAFIAAAVVWNAGVSWETISLILLIYLLGTVSIIDYQHHIIPDVITLSGMIIGLVFSAFRMPGIGGIVHAGLGIVAGGGTLWLVTIFGNWIFRKESMGGGDIKFAAMMGSFLGWKLVLIGVFIGFIMGAVFGLVSLVTGRKNRDGSPRNVLPFGPPLAAGGIISRFWGETLLAWYLSTFL